MTGWERLSADLELAWRRSHNKWGEWSALAPWECQMLQECEPGQRNRQIVMLRYGFVTVRPWTQQQIARRFALSTARVGQIIQRWLRQAVLWLCRLRGAWDLPPHGGAPARPKPKPAVTASAPTGLRRPLWPPSPPAAHQPEEQRAAPALDPTDHWVAYRWVTLPGRPGLFWRLVRIDP